MQQRILMCAPDYFGVDYIINPWMTGQIGKVDCGLARKEWNDLTAVIRARTDITPIMPQNGLPDFVFTANAALVYKNMAVISRFRTEERQKEEPHWHKWFEDHAFKILPWPKEIAFEGAGDALFDRGQELLWVAYGYRSDAKVVQKLGDLLNIKTVGLRLADPRFYHLDTCLCPLTGGYVMYFPKAFDAESQALIEKHLPEEKRIVVSEDDAMNFACNAVSLGKDVISNYLSPTLKQRLIMLGFTPIVTPLGEFMKAGGAAKCLTLKLIEP